ncbi:MAG: 50S ribosomal protein L25 [Candidatus Vogelbacteria bacterium CG10_big_fil_rev_8_21_14_0_10_45_14]|uniref:Large ribosomal subunit protein bL25 n=1 Tax=Candidatus Vogelbacteria bacterium CG10_big_fil_rev_8_21_14_0_10_45_14 TaxID=1975042 RepID=A0A2H0RKX8_9BACT|nr:MAG: 50S ribosomal protein L25 [Candidatus Vogelbacteria bacterium CG10_big_fil_rev_8_21_14_0_10_45_14]
MISLKAEKRDARGRALRKARAEGRLPAILYGPKESAFACFVNEVDFKKAWKEVGESSVMSLVVADGNAKDVLIHEVDLHPVTGVARHVDFYAIEAGKKVEVSVEIEFAGVSPAVKSLGATLVKVLYELEISAMPKDLPHEIVVDISSLTDLESQIHAKDIKLPPGVDLVTDPEEVVAAVAEQKAEEEEVKPVADMSTIEVEKKGKKEEEGAETTDKK